MDSFPDIKLADLPKPIYDEIIKITQRCWGQAAWYLDAEGAGHDDFLLFYGFRRDIVDFSRKYFCDKYYEFAAMRRITTHQLVNAFCLARRSDICYLIRVILILGRGLKRTTVADAKIKQLKETIVCRDKEISLLANAVMCRDEKIEKMFRIISNVAKIVL